MLNKYLNPAQMVADGISNIHTNNVGMYPSAGLDKDGRIEVEEQSNELFQKVREGDLDFITDSLTAHAIMLTNISTTCYKKARTGDYFKEYSELSIKASDQLRKTGLALAQIKNVTFNITNLSIQQENNVQLNQERQEVKEPLSINHVV